MFAKLLKRLFNSTRDPNLIWEYDKIKRVEFPYETCLGIYTLDRDRNGELSMNKEMRCPRCRDEEWVHEHGTTRCCKCCGLLMRVAGNGLTLDDDGFQLKFQRNSNERRSFK